MKQTEHELAVMLAKSIQYEKNEVLHVIDISGNVHKITQNLQNEVTAPESLDAVSKITIHNHPSFLKIPMTFSGEDAENLIKYNLDEILVCGYGYYFVMKRGKYTGSAEMLKRDLIKLYRAEERKHDLTEPGITKREYHDRIRRIEEGYHKAISRYKLETNIIYYRRKF